MAEMVGLPVRFRCLELGQLPRRQVVPDSDALLTPLVYQIGSISPTRFGGGSITSYQIWALVMSELQRRRDDFLAGAVSLVLAPFAFFAPDSCAGADDFFGAPKAARRGISTV